jgi:hypothetical protein
MQNQPGGIGAVSEQAKTITNHGGIEQMTLPEGFAESPTKYMHNNAEFKWLASSVKICYEELKQPLMAEDISEMKRLFAEQLEGSKASRSLNLYGEDQNAPDDSGAYGALCQSFVCGGALVPDGTCIDMDESKWEIRKLGDKNVLFARLKYMTVSGSRSSKEAILIMPRPCDETGSYYLWLEGGTQEIRKHEANFIAAVENGKFKSLA